MATPSANSRWGNMVAILTGDFLFARASQILADLGAEAIRIQAETFSRWSAGRSRRRSGRGRARTRWSTTCAWYGQDGLADRDVWPVRRDVLGRTGRGRRRITPACHALGRGVPAVRRHPGRRQRVRRSRARPPAPTCGRACGRCRCCTRCARRARATAGWSSCSARRPDRPAPARRGALPAAGPPGDGNGAHRSAALGGGGQGRDRRSARCPRPRRVRGPLRLRNPPHRLTPNPPESPPWRPPTHAPH